MGAVGRVRADRFAPVAFVLAGLLILTAALFPTADDPADYGGFLAVLVDNIGRTRVVLLTVPLGIWLFAVAVASLGPSETRQASVWLRVGLLGVVVGAAAVTVQFALGAAAVDVHLGDAAGGSELWAAATYVRSFGMLILWAGLAAVGAAVLTEGLAARWLGIVAIVLGVGMVAVSVVAIVGGPSPVTALATGGLAALTAVWAMGLGLSLYRR